MRFVVLAHTLPGYWGVRPEHWDLLVGFPGQALRAWRLADPLPAPGWRHVEPLAPHRASHLFLEGAARRACGWTKRVASGHVRVWCDDRTAYRATLHAPAGGGLIEIEPTAAGWRRRFVASVRSG